MRKYEKIPLELQVQTLSYKWQPPHNHHGAYKIITSAHERTEHKYS